MGIVPILSGIFLAHFLVIPSSAWLFGGPMWNDLRVTYGMNPFNSNYFDGLPKSVEEAEGAGWTVLSACSDSGKFRGVRYIKDNDPAVILLYQGNGRIVGIQCGISKTGLPSNYPSAKQIGQIFQEDGDYYTLTAYFENPKKISCANLPAPNFEEYGLGSGLYIQNGSDPVTQSISIPLNEAGLANTSWTRGKCFIFMGQHYWYDVSTNMNCDDFQPVFPLYNSSGSLIAFGWALGLDQNSPRYEHPQHDQLTYFFQEVPVCLTTDYPTISTMHIYMTRFPRTNTCI